VLGEIKCRGVALASSFKEGLETNALDLLWDRVSNLPGGRRSAAADLFKQLIGCFALKGGLPGERLVKANAQPDIARPVINSMYLETTKQGKSLVLPKSKTGTMFGWSRLASVRASFK